MTPLCNYHVVYACDALTFSSNRIAKFLQGFKDNSGRPTTILRPDMWCYSYAMILTNPGRQTTVSTRFYSVGIRSLRFYEKGLNLFPNLRLLLIRLRLSISLHPRIRGQHIFFPPRPRIRAVVRQTKQRRAIDPDLSIPDLSLIKLQTINLLDSLPILSTVPTLPILVVCRVCDDL